MVDVIIQHLIVDRIMSPGIVVPGACQTDSDRSGMANLVVLDNVPRVVVFDIDSVAADGIEMVILYATMRRAPHTQSFAAVFPSFACSWGHGAVALVPFTMHIVAARGFREGEPRYRDPGGRGPGGCAHIDEAVKNRHHNLCPLDGCRRPEVKNAVLTVQTPFARLIQLLQDVFHKIGTVGPNDAWVSIVRHAQIVFDGVHQSDQAILFVHRLDCDGVAQPGHIQQVDLRLPRLGPISLKGSRFVPENLPSVLFRRACEPPMVLFR